jgi:Amidohydrolase family
MSKYRLTPGMCPCCSQHAMLALGAMMAAGGQAPTDTGPHQSFVDGPAPQPTAAVFGDDSRTHDLFDVATQGQWILVRGGTVLPMTGSGALPNHDVLIQNGVIKSVQPTGAAAPEGAKVVDASGRFVIPGLTDIHQHPMLDHVRAVYAPIMGPDFTLADFAMPYDLLMLQYIASGITRIQVMAGSSEDLANRESIRKGRYRGPHIRVGSPVIDGPPAIWSLAFTWLVGDADGGRKAAQLIAERGYDFAKPYTMLGRDAYFALAKECQALGIEMMGHIPRLVKPEEAFAAGQLGVAHSFEYFYHEQGEERFRADSIAKRVKMSKDLGVTLQSTVQIARVLEYDVGFLPASSVNFADTLDPILRHIMREESPFIQSWRMNPIMVESGRDAFAHSVNICKALLAEGVRVLPGTDMSAAAITGDNSLHHELRVLVEDVGMTPADVLRAATRDCADYQGEAGVAGTVEAGMRADLLVLDADPTKSISATTMIDTVILGDAILRRDARARGIARIKARYDAMPKPVT